VTADGAKAPRPLGARVVHGRTVDDQTRCVHYAGPLDVLAILFPCCDRWYPCRECHDEDADHPGRPWDAGRRDAHALLCGRCGDTTSIAEYARTSACGRCGGPFNPACRAHHHLYFA